MPHVVDRRCPRCNRPVRGREDVPILVSVEADKETRQCQFCKVTVEFVSVPDDLGEGYHYRMTGGPPPDPLFDVVQDIGSVFPSATTSLHAHIPHGNICPSRPGATTYTVCLNNLTADQARKIVETIHEISDEPEKSRTRKMRNRLLS